MPLVSLSDLKTRLGISGSADDTLLGLLQNTADQWVERYCDRRFDGGTFTETHPGGSTFVHLRNYPVATLTSVKVDSTRQFGAETLVSADDYVLHADRGVIQSIRGPFLPPVRRELVNLDPTGIPFAPGMVQVVYTTAGGQVPADVQHAYARMTAEWYRRVKTESSTSFIDVVQQKLADSFVILKPESDGVPADVSALLRSYRPLTV